MNGTNIVVEYRGADGKIERFPDVVSELIRFEIDIIVAPNTPAARAVKQATTTIPIVVPVVGDPVGDGLVARNGSSVIYPEANLPDASQVDDSHLCQQPT